MNINKELEDLGCKDLKLIIDDIEINILNILTRKHHAFEKYYLVKRDDTETVIGIEREIKYPNDRFMVWDMRTRFCFGIIEIE